MQYADVAVAARMGLGNRMFTYAIPPELLPSIAPGVVIDVPFRQTHVAGVICQLQSRLARPTLAAQLRPIRRVISPWPLLGPAELRLRQRLADDTLSSLATTATLLFPPPSLYAELTPPALEQSGHGTIIWQLSHPATELTGLTGRIEETVAKKLAVLVLAPIKNFVNEVAGRLRRSLPSCPIVHFDRDMRVASQLPAWRIALGNAPGVIVGTRSAALLPMRQPGLIIILEPNDRQFEEEQAPHWQALQVTQLRQELFGANVIGITPLPPLAYFVGGQRRAARMRAKSPNQPKIMVTKRVAGPQLGPTSAQLIEHALSAHQSVVIAVPQRGWAAGFVCQECGTILRCQQCGHLLQAADATGAAICHTCQNKYQISHCQHCHSPRVRTFGLGSDQWLAELKNRFPTAGLATTEQDEPLPKNWHILVTLPERLSRTLAYADHVIAFEPERLLSAGNYRANERFSRMLLELRNRARTTLLIETATPDLPIFSELGDVLPKTSLSSDLALRRRYHYPPFGRLLRLTAPKNSRSVERIQALLPQAELIGSGSEILVKIPLAQSPQSLSALRHDLPRGAQLRVE